MAATKGSILVTGANGGLGSAIAEHIAKKPELSTYHGLYTVRDAPSAPALASALAHGGSSHPHEHDVISLDLTKLDNVRQVANHINGRVSAGQIPPIKALILAAGHQDFGKQTWTGDGFDTTFASNYLGHWLLTLMLLQSMDKTASRIVIIGSWSHNPYDPRGRVTGAFSEDKYKTYVRDPADFEAIAKGTFSSAKESPGFVGGFRRYGASKLFLITMMHELQARLSRSDDAGLRNIGVLGVDPGTMITGMQRLSPWIIRVFLFKIIYPTILYFFPNRTAVRSTSRSAADTLEAAFGVKHGELPRDLYLDGTTPCETSVESQDVQKREMVWKETAVMVNMKEGETVLDV
ncbi:hypothetical protein ANO14919_109350 [Xylariales sp. No.14919]|nr:hypothetical protein ANO14919_109350 [Xylariales sp. No.14919]